MTATIIAGSRTIKDRVFMDIAMRSCPWQVTRVLCGQAQGADTLGEEWALRNGLMVDYHPADWNQWGKRAGFVRNAHMATLTNALVLLWDGESRGSAHMRSCIVGNGGRPYLLHEIIIPRWLL